MQYQNRLKNILQGKSLLLTTLLLIFSASSIAQTVPCRADFDFEIDQNSMTIVAEGKSNQKPVVFGWDMGDGTFLRGDRIKHEYAKAGSYELCMVAIAFNQSTNQRCTTKVCKKVEIVNCDRLKARFAFEVDGLTIKVKGGANADSISAGFTFGDGSSERGKEAKHTYDKPGVYVVCFIVEDLKYGCRQKVCQRVLIEKERCNIEADFKIEKSGYGVKVKARSNRNNVHYFWAFGDGNDATGQKAAHRYKKAGVYTISLIVFNPKTKCKTLVCKRVLIERKCNLKATFKIRKDEDIVYLKVRSNATLATKYIWDFGDGTTVTTSRKAIRHKYKKKGVYTIKLIVVDKRRKCRVLVEKKVVIGRNFTTTNTLSTIPANDDSKMLNEAPQIQLDNNWNANVSPSPARDVVSFSSDDKNLAMVKVMDANGVEVIQSTGTLNQLDVTILPKGFYYAHITAADGTTKVVKFLKH